MCSLGPAMPSPSRFTRKHSNDSLVVEGALDALADGYIVVSPSWHILLENPASERILGAPRGGRTGRLLWDAIPILGTEPHAEFLQATMADRKTRTFALDRQEWPELDFHQPKLHEDIERRFVFLHTRAFRGRSYFRVFYRFPEGRQQLEEYLKKVEAVGVDWKTAGQNGFIQLKPDAPQLPAGTEVSLVQFLMALDTNLQPVPTSLVESVRVMVHKSPTGENDTSTNTEIGINVAKYTLKRRLAFTDMKYGGLKREPDDLPVYRILFESENAQDWGPRGRFFEG